MLRVRLEHFSFRVTGPHPRRFGNMVPSRSLTELFGRTAEWLSMGLPLMGCALAWWSWLRQTKTPSPQYWRRIAAVAGLVSVTTSIAFGAFARVYWNRFPDPSPGPPRPTYVATYAGLYLTLAALPLSLGARGGVRAALLLCCSGLLGFYFLMFLAP
jgi:hypothetical protein